MDYMVWTVFSYLLGSVPIGYWLGKLKGIDLTEEGSGSTGATNVLRKVGKIEALITLVFDISKGFLCVYLAMKFGQNQLIVLLSAIACIIGHSKSIFLKFKGGKSSASSLGILIAINWKVALIIFSIWLVVVFISKYSSLGSIVTIPLAPIFLYIFHEPIAYILFVAFVAVYIVLIRHIDNIKRLLNGTEPKIKW